MSQELQELSESEQEPLEYKTKSAAQQKALELLGAGVSSEAVAAAVGVTPGYISQLLSDENFASAVASLRYQFLAANNQRDEKYNSLEDKLLDKLETAMPFLIRPGEITKALHVVNNCKRRGQNAPETPVNNKQVIVNLIIPTLIAQKFTTNVVNQVIKAGDQELLTMPSNMLLQKAEERQKQEIEQEIANPSNPLLEELGG